MPSPFSVPTRFAILSCIITAVSTLIWIPGATRPCSFTNSDPTNRMTILSSNQPLPTGVTNDLLVTSARHPVYASAIAQLPVFNAITRAWARLQPHCAIMISAGPMFLTMAVKKYLLERSPLPSKAVGVVNATELAPFITDLESSTWHRADTTMLVWIGNRPWTWFSAGAIGLVVGLVLFNRLLMFLCGIFRKNASGTFTSKVFKAS